MATFSGGTARQELVNVIRQVRSRWRMQAPAARRRHRPRRRAGRRLPSPPSASRPTSSARRRSSASASASSSAFALLLGLWLVRPIGRRVTDLQVALYVEEHEPSLQAAILSAVDIGAASEAGTSRRAAGHRRQAGRAGRREVPDDRGRQGGRPRVACGVTPWRSALIAGIGALLLVIGPEFLRQGASALLVAVDERRSRQPVRHQGHARRRESAEGIRSDDRRAGSPGFRSNDVGVDGEGRGRAEVRAHAARRHR